MTFAVIESVIKIIAPISKSFAGAFVCLKKLAKKMTKFGIGMLKVWEEKVSKVKD